MTDLISTTTGTSIVSKPKINMNNNSVNKGQMDCGAIGDGSSFSQDKESSSALMDESKQGTKSFSDNNSAENSSFEHVPFPLQHGDNDYSSEYNHLNGDTAHGPASIESSLLSSRTISNGHGPQNIKDKAMKIQSAPEDREIIEPSSAYDQSLSMDIEKSELPDGETSGIGDIKVAEVKFLAKNNPSPEEKDAAFKNFNLPTDLPSLGDIKQALPPHVFESSLSRSMYFVLKDAVIISVLFLVAEFLWSSELPDLVLYPCIFAYWILQVSLLFSFFEKLSCESSN